MKNHNHILPTLLLLLITSCQFPNEVTPSKNLIEFDVSIDNIDAIKASGVYKINIHKGEKEVVNLKCNTNIKEYLNIYQKGNTIYLEMDNLIADNMIAEADITIKDLKEISCSGAVEVDIKKSNYETINLNLSGASTIKSKMFSSNQLFIKASGASALKLKGKVLKLYANFSGASKLKGKGLIVAENATIDCSGASRISVAINGDLNVDLSGASELNYYGTPKSIKKSLSGASKIKQK